MCDEFLWRRDIALAVESLVYIGICISIECLAQQYACTRAQLVGVTYI